ncbi:hypothetical protein [Raineya orbicola]|uniref:Lipoprotein n=1 Tax=Raineya orbicola TaxID=2016530 RepID=A0A2N3IE99_9BACT|nr:hypothetical protein [Raineya orbicola]PKQ68598.1 hypothetical protein Rain11_1576 [Raineya orbicola]
MRYLGLLAICTTTLFVFSCKEKDKETKQKADSSKVQKIEEKPVQIDRLATSQAEILAALVPQDTTKYGKIINSDIFKKHQEAFNKGWENLESKYLSKIRPWRDKELADMNKEGVTVFYPFSGPDILNAYNLFPNADNFIMFGLEMPGLLEKDLYAKDDKFTNAYFADVRNALEDIFARNYFITSYMGSDLYRRANGVAPLMCVFLARTGNEIVNIQRVGIDKDAKPIFKDIYTSKADTTYFGLFFEVKNKNRKNTQKIYYFWGDVSDFALVKKPQFDKFIRSFPNKVGYLKSASYVLFNPNFQIVKKILLEDTSVIFQDDTGVPYRDFVAAGNWDIQLYGKYSRPVADFGSYTHQPDLRDAFKDSSKVKKIDFRYGYHWKTDGASLIVARRNNNPPKYIQPTAEEHLKKYPPTKKK